jgi:arsenate reductase (thioredoxin)
MKLVDTKKTVLFICKHNSARSQMVEGLLKELYGQYYNVYSAGTNPGKVRPYAVQVMANRGINISKNRSKSLNEFKGVKFDYVVTVCDGEGDACPFFPGAKTYIHKSFKDPTLVKGDENEKIICFTQIRNQIEEWIKTTFKR